MDQANASVILSPRFERLKTSVEKLRVICALAGCGYQVEKIQCVDMFCWTGVETVCLLSNPKRKPDTYVNLAIDTNEIIMEEQKMKNNSKPKLKVQIRGGFSDRNNINPVNKTIQYKEFDERARTAIANTINALYHAVFREIFLGQQKKNAFWKDTLSDVYSQQVDFSDSVSYREDGMFEVFEVA